MKGLLLMLAFILFVSSSSVFIKPDNLRRDLKYEVGDNETETDVNGTSTGNGDSLTNNQQSKEVLITGGEMALEGEFPWQISLQKGRGNNFRHFCGGSIIDESHVICAAHCTDGQNPSQIIVVAGAHNMKDPEEPSQQRVPVKRFIGNPKYSSRRIAFDSAIIELAEPLVFNERVKPIRLAPEGHEPSGDCVNSGWGNANRFGLRPVIIPDSLQKVNMTIMSRGLCRFHYFFVKWVTRSMICGAAGHFQGSCNGDSGGPLVCYDLPDDPEPYLAGIVSWGMAPCGQKFFPSVFANVAYMRDFIDKVVTLRNETTDYIPNNI